MASSSTSAEGPRSPHPLPEDSIARAIAGEPQALGLVVEVLTPFLIVQAAHRLGVHAGDARVEDLVQDTWWQFFRSRESLDFQGEGAAQRLCRWLAQTVLYLANNHLRYESRRRPIPMEADGNASGGLDLWRDTATTAMRRASRKELARRVVAAFDALTPEEREIVILRGMEGLPAQDVARELGMKPNTLTVRYRRIIERLRGIVAKPLLDTVFES